MAVNPGSLSGVRLLKPESQHEAFTCWGRRVLHFLAGTALGNHLCGKLSLFCLPSPYCSLRFQSSPLSPSMKGFASVQKLFFHHNSLLRAQVPAPRSLSFYVSLSFALCHSDEIRLPFGSLGSSLSIQKVFRRSCSTCRWISDVFVGREVILSHSSTILKLLHLLFLFVLL